MSNENNSQSSQTQIPRPLTEEKGLQPATQPPSTPPVKPPKQEKSD